MFSLFSVTPSKGRHVMDVCILLTVTNLGTDNSAFLKKKNRGSGEGFCLKPTDTQSPSTDFEKNCT